jgi:hypothetical protein
LAAAASAAEITAKRPAVFRCFPLFFANEYSGREDGAIAKTGSTDALEKDPHGCDGIINVAFCQFDNATFSRVAGPMGLAVWTYLGNDSV